MELLFKTHGNDKQKQVCRLWLNPAITDIVYGGSKGSGKSFLGCSLIFGDALTYPGTHWFIARKKLNDLRKFTIPSIHEVFKLWGITENYYSYNGQDNFFTLYNGSKVFLLDAKYLPSDPIYARFGSMQMTGGWIEEAGEFEVEAKNNLAASIGRWKNEEYNLPANLLQTCNPSKNYLYADYYKPSKEGLLEAWKAFIQALPQDNKMLDKGYLESLDRTLSKNEKERLLKGNWEYDDDPQKLFNDFDKILDLFHNNKDIVSGGAKYLSADIAYEGSDMFVIGAWNGLILHDVTGIDKIDEVAIARTITDKRIPLGIPIGNTVYDADGLKMFVRQSGKTGLLVGAKEFHNGGKALYGENYYNLKSQCYFKLAEYVNQNKIFISDQRYRKQIIEELEQIKKMERSDDKEPLRVERKIDLRARLGRSPDFVDMMAMRMIYELKPQTNNISILAGLVR